jgi:hypothetical protein
MFDLSVTLRVKFKFAQQLQVYTNTKFRRNPVTISEVKHADIQNDKRLHIMHLFHEQGA